MSKTQYKTIGDTTTVTKLVRANPKRQELMITNNSSATLYLSFGNLPSATNYAAKLLPNDVLITANPEDVIGVWDADTSGAANILEQSDD